jgi:cytochrome bd ubiquinol oxidase subunit I
LSLPINQYSSIQIPLRRRRRECHDPKADLHSIPFFTFRIMVGCGLLMLGLAWFGSLLQLTERIDRQRLLLWAICLSFPLPFIATLTGWFTAEVGRQPWTVYGVLRTADSVTPSLTVGETIASLAFFGSIYLLIFSFGTIFIFRLIKAGPDGGGAEVAGNAKRPMAVAGKAPVWHAEEAGW